MLTEALPPPQGSARLPSEFDHINPTEPGKERTPRFALLRHADESCHGIAGLVFGRSAPGSANRGMQTPQPQGEFRAEQTNKAEEML